MAAHRSPFAVHSIAPTGAATSEPPKANHAQRTTNNDTQRVPGTTNFERLLPLLVALPGLGLVLVGAIGWGFNGLYGQDPYAYFDYGVGPLRHFILGAHALPAMFWPLGYPALIALLSLPLGTGPVAGQAASALAGLAATVLTYLLGRDVLVLAGANRSLAVRSAAIGAMALGLTGWAVKASTLTLADSTALAAALLSAWALVRWRMSQSKAALAEQLVSARVPLRRTQDSTLKTQLWLGLAGAALGWSVITRWGQLALLPVWGLALLPDLRRGPAAAARAAAWALVPFAVIVGAQLALTFSIPPAPDLGRWPFAGDLGLLNGGGGWSLAHLFQHSFSDADGVQRYAMPNLLFYVTQPASTGYLTPIFAAPALVGVWLVLASFRGALSWLVLWPVALVLLDAGLAEQNPRFVMAFLPPLAILAGLGTAWLGGWVAGVWRAVVLTLLALAFAVVGLSAAGQLHALVAASRSDRDVAAWAAARVPRDATLVSFEITLTLSHDTTLRPLDLSELSPAGLRGLARVGPLYLLVRPTTMRGQMASQTPGVDFRFLRDALGLLPLGNRATYTLYRTGHA